MSDENEEEIRREALIAEMVSLGIDDPLDRTFPKRLYDNLVWLAVEREYLLDKLHYVEDLVDKTEPGIVPGTDRPDRRLGTTVGDLPGFEGEKPTDEEPGSLKQDLIDRLWNSINGSGVNIQPGEAAGKPKGNETGTNPPPTKEDRDFFRDAAEEKKNQNDFLASYLFYLHYFLQEKEKNEKLLKEIDAVWKQIVKKQPVPDAVDGNYQPKHPQKDPYTERLRHPKGLVPIGDPPEDKEAGETGGVLRIRGQAVDPNPDGKDDNDGPQKTIKTTTDAVTDPLPYGSGVGLVGRIRQAFGYIFNG